MLVVRKLGADWAIFTHHALPFIMLAAMALQGGFASLQADPSHSRRKPAKSTVDSSCYAIRSESSRTLMSLWTAAEKAASLGLLPTHRHWLSPVPFISHCP